MDGHLRTCTVDGINIGELIFNWKDKLIIFHNKNSDENIVNIHTYLSDPYVDRKVEVRVTDEELEQQGQAFEIVSMFLACYHLSNDLNMPKIITKSWSAMKLEQIESIQDIKFSGFISQNKSTFDVFYKIEDTIKALNNTKTLFSKVMDLDEKSRKLMSIALIMYQQARASDEIMLQFLGMVTVLEILFTFDENKLKKKFASRISGLYYNDSLKRDELNKKLKEIYKDRSELVHGNKITLNPESLYHKHYEFLLLIVFQILKYYVQFLSENITKKEIIKHLDEKFPYEEEN